MGLKIDNWGKWMALAIFSFCNTGINEFISNALDPWFVNSLQVFTKFFTKDAQIIMRSSSQILKNIKITLPFAPQKGSQDQEHRVLACHVPVDRADPLHLRACHGHLCTVPLLLASGLCNHQAAGGSPGHWILDSVVHTGIVFDFLIIMTMIIETITVHFFAGQEGDSFVIGIFFCIF